MVTRKDLSDIGDVNYQERQGEYIQCQDCGESFGGTRGDYWEYAMDTLFKCPQCESENLALVRNQTQTIIVKK